MKLDDERERQCRMFFNDNDIGVDYKEEFLNVKRWGINWK